jgi:hypothetical protein
MTHYWNRLLQRGETVVSAKLPLANLVVACHNNTTIKRTDNRHVSPPAPCSIYIFVKEQNPTQVRTILKKHDTKVSTGFTERILDFLVLIFWVQLRLFDD